MTGREIAGLIDHTLLRPEAVAADVRKLCAEAGEFEFASVCINPYWVRLAASELKNSPVKICTVVGFPLGANMTSIKSAEASAALDAGAREIDMVLNIGELRAGNREAVQEEIASLASIAHRAEAILKVILETALLDDEQKQAACVLAKQASADFVKTSTGFGPRGATVADVALMRRAAGPEMGVKASGGIRTIDDLKSMVNAGATRIGTSAGVKIVESVER